MHLIVGLGNPGEEYKLTRHNMGFLVADELAKQFGISFKLSKTLNAEIAKSETAILCKPQTFMNASGEAVKAATRKFNIPPEKILVVSDDADLLFGEIRVRESGSSGGHNGLQSIMDQFPGANIPRVRIGIGRSDNPNIPLDAWVLSKWTPDETQKLPDIISKATDAAKTVIARNERSE